MCWECCQPFWENPSSCPAMSPWVALVTLPELVNVNLSPGGGADGHPDPDNGQPQLHPLLPHVLTVPDHPHIHLLAADTRSRAEQSSRGEDDGLLIWDVKNSIKNILNSHIYEGSFDNFNYLKTQYSSSTQQIIQTIGFICLQDDIEDRGQSILNLSNFCNKSHREKVLLLVWDI